MNIKDLKVVYLNLLNYSQRVPFKYNGKLLELVCFLYNNIKLGKRLYSFKQAYSILYHFNTSIRFAYNLCSYDELRNYFAKITYANPQVSFPSEREYLQYIRGVLSKGLVSAAFQAQEEAIMLLDELKKNYLDHLDDINALSDHPLFYSIYNNYTSSYETIKGFQEGKHDIMDTINNVVLIKVDKLVGLSRETVRQVSNLDKL